MQKNYRDYTVGELLDMGVDVEISNHKDQSLENAFEFVQRFEGVKNSSKILESETLPPFTLVRGWKGQFEVKCFVDIKESESIATSNN